MKSTDVFYVWSPHPKIPITGQPGGGYKIQPAADAPVGNYQLKYALNDNAAQSLAFTVT